MSELEPTPELPDNTPIREVGFPSRIKNALFAAGLKPSEKCARYQMKRYLPFRTLEKSRSLIFAKR
jgi:hypothetical protein